MARILIVALLPCLLAPLAAQHYQFRQYGEEDGLTNLAVVGLFQDRTGYLWVSTEAGIFRFDGSRFTPIPTPT